MTTKIIDLVVGSDGIASVENTRLPAKPKDIRQRKYKSHYHVDNKTNKLTLCDYSPIDCVKCKEKYPTYSTEVSMYTESLLEVIGKGDV